MRPRRVTGQTSGHWPAAGGSHLLLTSSTMYSHTHQAAQAQEQVIGDTDIKQIL